MQSKASKIFPSSPIEPAKLASCQVLILEDDSDARGIIRYALSQIGLSVLEAGDGEEGKAICEMALPSLVVADVMMPRCTGVEFTEWLKQTYGDVFVPVLMLTALSDVENRVKGLEAGADDYLTKPFDYRELQARVHALLRIKLLTDTLAERNQELGKVNEDLRKAQQTIVERERELVAMQLAGAAAHNLGQPVTSILLLCSLIEKSLAEVQPKNIEQARKDIAAVKHECQAIQNILTQLNLVDPSKSVDYLGSKILDLTPKS